MTVSYALTTLLAVLLIEILLGITALLGLTYGPFLDNTFISGAKQAAKLYALAAAVQAGESGLDPQTTFEAGQAASIALRDVLPDPNDPTHAPYDLPDSGSSNAPYALLITPTGQILASSNPERFPLNRPVTQFLPAKSQLISQALAGTPQVIVEGNSEGRIISAVETIWDRHQKVIGAVYLQVPELSAAALLQNFSKIWLISGLIWLVITVPVGSLFGLVTTRNLIGRLRRLANATLRFAGGDYSERVMVSRQDEVGQLEQHFNSMAQQLVESLNQRQTLAEQNARMLERNRIARDLHDSVKQQVFAISMQLGAALSLWEVKPPLALQHLSEADKLAYQAQQELTTLIHQLRPLALQDKGLSLALQQYLTNWQRQQNVEVDMKLAECGFVLPEIEEALWRVAQEALSNIARHSQASCVKVSLACEPGKVTLAIQDNGKGFDQPLSNHKGVGLSSMQERMESVGGTLTLNSRAGEGTFIQAECSY